MNRKLYFGVGASVVGLALVGWLGTNRSAPARTGEDRRPVIPETAESALNRDVPTYVRGIGTVQAYNKVVVKSRVGGHITRVSFEEGREVKEGQPLFQIDPRPFQAALDQLEAARDKDRAQLRVAQLDLDRYGRLVGKAYQSRQSYDNQKSTVERLQNAIRADEAQIENAKLNLAYADIRSPINGCTGARLVDLGNFVQSADGTPLVAIMQIKPIYINFTLPQDWLDTMRRNHEITPLTVQAYASDDRRFLSEGKLSLIDNQIDTSTGTVHFKALFENADERLWPGELVSVRVVLETRKNVVTVPIETVMQGPNGAYVYVIKPDDTVERRAVQLAGAQDGLAMVEKGVEAGQRVVVEGQYRLANGLKVRIETRPEPLS
jgi:multidrug efflux system membrane fusion protein